ncbi:hypothetical protein [Streptomyces cyaneofuscatus]|uniref:hypothetical protein n=1 Tax=Streptomyces TaxID=1883 RepID=UPI002E131F01|nr:hypothetical protein OG366_22290 [Streptomyces cyaneofuscatus]
MATKKYTVTLPEELAEEIRAEVGRGAFSAYVTRAMERQREHDRLGELVHRLEGEYGPVTDADLAAAEAERCESERGIADRATDEEPAPPGRRDAADGAEAGTVRSSPLSPGGGRR